VFHVTHVKRKLKQFLLDQLPLILQRADLESGDGVTTPVPYEIYTTDKADIGGMPSLELIVTDSTPVVDSFAKVYRHRIVIGVTVGGDDEERNTVWVERYIWCLRELFRDEALTPVEGTGPVDTGGEQYTPLQQRPETVETPFVKGAFIEVFVKTVE
jgi:hypothetical protein